MKYTVQSGLNTGLHTFDCNRKCFKLKSDYLAEQIPFSDDKFFSLFIEKNPARCNIVSKFIIPYLCEAHRVSGDTPPITKSLKLH